MRPDKDGVADVNRMVCATPTAPWSTRELGPIVTSPVTTAEGATQAVGSI